MTGQLASELTALARRHPEWQPWLEIVGAVVQESADAKWDASVPDVARQKPVKSPLLAGVTVEIDPREVRNWVERLFRIARESGTPQLSTLRAVSDAPLDCAAWFRQSLCHKAGRLREAVAGLEINAEALEAVAGFVAVPFLQACGRRWAEFAGENWTQGYCPICGAWPAFVETRGIERIRALRCGRCGSAWSHDWLHCPYCGMDDHQALVALVPERDSGASRTIEGCKQCHGYLKNFTTLEGGSGAKVILDDLATVDLDVAAVEQGFRRPEGPGYALEVWVTEKRSKWSFFA